jgi:hypothetical protein
VLSTINNAVDCIRLVTPDHTTYYATHANRWLDRITTRSTELNLNTSVTETTAVSYTLAQSLLQVGTTFRVTLRGTVQVTSTSGILTLRVYLGANAASQTFVMATQTAAAGPVAFFLQADITVRTTGASGTYIVAGEGAIAFTTRVFLDNASATTTVVDTTPLSGPPPTPPTFLKWRRPQLSGSHDTKLGDIFKWLVN